jgi:histidyl-tRNA synthetase
MSDLIEARVLKGFRDFLPEAEIERRLLTETLERTFRAFGFVPIDTPALEYAEILLGKGGGETEKQVYRFRTTRPGVALASTDRTLSRGHAKHKAELPLPFKRYHISKVWRGENTPPAWPQPGIHQCDFARGTESAPRLRDPPEFDAGILAPSVSGTHHQVSHRGVFNRIPFTLGGIGNRWRSSHRGQAAKIGRGNPFPLAEIAGKRRRGNPGSTNRKRFRGVPAGDDRREGRHLPRNRALATLGPSCSIWAGRVFVLDPRTPRFDYIRGGLRYLLKVLPEIGSVCSGGRYDDLASLYSKERLPGVGASIGLDRLIAALEALGRSRRSAGFASVAIACLDEGLGGRYQAIAQAFRATGVSCEVLVEVRKPVQQYALAEKKAPDGCSSGIGSR